MELATNTAIGKFTVKNPIVVNVLYLNGFDGSEPNNKKLVTNQIVYPAMLENNGKVFRGYSFAAVPFNRATNKSELFIDRQNILLFSIEGNQLN